MAEGVARSGSKAFAFLPVAAVAFAADQVAKFEKNKELDFSFGVANLGRFRTNTFMQRPRRSVESDRGSDRVPSGNVGWMPRGA